MPITRVEKQSDGSRVVIGPVSDGLLDWDDQIVDPDWAAEKLAQWFNDLDKGGFGATIHQMHSPLLAPAGKGKDLFFEGGVPHVRAKVVEPTAIKLVDEKCYQGFSIGILDPPIFPDPKAKNGRIGSPGAGGFINEVSLVDTPANPRCLFSLAKRARATDPIERTERVSIVDGGIVIPLEEATHGQLVKALGRGIRLGKKKNKLGKDEERDEHGRWSGGGSGGSSGGGDKPLGETHPGLDPLNRQVPHQKGKKKKGRKKDWQRYDEGRESGSQAPHRDSGEPEGHMGGVPMERQPSGVLQHQEKILVAAAWYAIVKRDMDPNVGGGVDRDKLDPSDYVFPATKTFPVVTPGDVSDAVSSWGRYKGPESFDSFKSKLTALARRKGPEFVKELPAAWGAKPKKGKKMPNTATKAKKDGGDSAPSDDGGAKCPTCNGTKTIMEGNRKCPDCNGTGKKQPGGDKKKGKKSVGDPASDKAVQAATALAAQAQQAANAASQAGSVAGAAVAAAVTKSLTKDADDDVSDALDDAASDLGDAISAQGEDDQDGKPTDDVVDEALSDAAGALSAVAAAQGADELADVMSGKGKKGKRGKGKIPPQFAAEDEKKPKKKGKGKKKGRKERGNGGGGGNAGANVDPNVGASTALPGDALVMTGGVSDDKCGPMGKSKSKKGKGKRVTKGKKKSKKKGLPSVEKRLHDILCPAYSGKAIKTAFGAIGKDLAPVEVLAPEYFAAQMAERSRTGKGDIAEAYQALAAATKLSTLKAPTFMELREKASRKFMDAYPNVHLTPQQIDPSDYHRPFLAGAVDETSSVTRVPMPDLKDVFTASDFNRGPLTTNESRPTLSSGTSVAKGKRKKQGKGTTAGAGNPNSRQFYTNAAKDENQNAMAMLHDHIVSRYPGVCPMEAVQPGTDIDRDGQAGSPAEMQAKGPGVDALPTPAGASDSGTLRPVGKSKSTKKSKDKAPKSVGKAAGTAAPDIEGLVKKGLRKERKRTERRERRLGKKLSRTRRQLTKRSDELQKALAAPNPRHRAHLGTSPANFTPKGVDPAKVTEAKQAAEHIRALKSRAVDPNSQVASQAVDELMRVSGSPKEFARIMAADPE